MDLKSIPTVQLVQFIQAFKNDLEYTPMDYGNTSNNFFELFVVIEEEVLEELKKRKLEVILTSDDTAWNDVTIKLGENLLEPSNLTLTAHDHDDDDHVGLEINREQAEELKIFLEGWLEG